MWYHTDVFCSICNMLCVHPSLHWLSVGLHDVSVVDVIRQHKYRSHTSIHIISGTYDIKLVYFVASASNMLCVQPSLHWLCVGLCVVSVVDVMRRHKYRSDTSIPACISSLLVHMVSQLSMWWGKINIGLMHPFILFLQHVILCQCLLYVAPAYCTNVIY